VLLLRLRADAILQLSIKAAGRRSRGCARHSLAEILASYLAHWFRSPEAGFEFFSRAREGAGETRRVAAPSRPVPKNSGRRGGAFSFSPAERGLRGAILASLALAQASETETNSGRIWCRSEGILNEFIVSKSGWIHKAKTPGGIEFIAFLFSGLRGVAAATASFVPEPGNGRKASVYSLRFGSIFKPIPACHRRRKDARAAIKCAWALRRSGSGRFHRLSGAAGRRIVRLLVRS
jgi:hypothetical protein